MIADLVYEITSTSGTGPLTLGGARSADFRTFASAHSIGDKVFYCVRGGGQWEVGQGTLTSATVLARTTVYNGSSGAGVAVNFASGNKELYETPNSGSFIDIGALPASGTFADVDNLLVLKADGSLQTILGSIVKASGTGGAPADTTGPTLSSPTGASTGTTTASGSVTTNEGNGTLYYLATANATETVATVKASGATQAVSSTGSKSVGVTGLTASTQYYLHFVQTDAAANDSARVTSSSFTTAAAGDTTAPTLSSPTGTQTGQATAIGTVSTNEANGTLYRYISTNAVESAATIKAANLTQAVTATGVQNVSATSLTAATVYYWHFVHRDAAGNDSTAASSASFTTASASGYSGPDYLIMTNTGTDNSGSPIDGYVKLPTNPSVRPANVMTNFYLKTADGQVSVPDNVEVKFAWRKVGLPTPTFADLSVPMAKTGWSGTNSSQGYFGLMSATGTTFYIDGADNQGNYELLVGTSDGFIKKYTENGSPYVLVVT